MGKKFKKRKAGRVKESPEGKEYPGKNRGETQPEITREDTDLLRSKPDYPEDISGEEDEEDSFYDLGGDDHDDLAEDQGGINI